MTPPADNARDFGGQLRALREARGVTLRSIAGTTNIPMTQLEALERNDIKRLPGGIFLRGIVRSYAQEIGVDPDATVRDFVASFPDEAVGGAPHASPIDYEKATTPRRNLRGVGLLAVVLVVLGAALAWFASR